MFRSVDRQIDTERCALSIYFICNFYTFFKSMDENEEDIEENDSDIDGEVMNMASNLICSTPAVASPTTLSSSSFWSTSTHSMHASMRGHGRTVSE